MLEQSVYTSFLDICHWNTCIHTNTNRDASPAPQLLQIAQHELVEEALHHLRQAPARVLNPSVVAVSAEGHQWDREGSEASNKDPVCTQRSLIRWTLPQHATAYPSRTQRARRPHTNAQVRKGSQQHFMAHSAGQVGVQEEEHPGALPAWVHKERLPPHVL